MGKLEVVMSVGRDTVFHSPRGLGRCIIRPCLLPHHLTAAVYRTSVPIIVPDTFYLLIDMPADSFRSGTPGALERQPRSNLCVPYRNSRHFKLINLPLRFDLRSSQGARANTLYTLLGSTLIPVYLGVHGF